FWHFPIRRTLSPAVRRWRGTGSASRLATELRESSLPLGETIGPSKGPQAKYYAALDPDVQRSDHAVLSCAQVPVVPTQVAVLSRAACFRSLRIPRVASGVAASRTLPRRRPPFLDRQCAAA